MFFFSVYKHDKFKIIFGKHILVICLKIITYYKKMVGYNMDIMKQSACLVVKPITVYNYVFLFDCTTVGQASDSMTALTKNSNQFVGLRRVVGWAHRGST